MILYRETAEGGRATSSWDHPDNRLVLATGPLAGLPVWGTGGLTVVTIGAGTNGPDLDAGQRLLRHQSQVLRLRRDRASRASPSGWVYLYINDDVVELRDAGELVGNDTWETQDAPQRHARPVGPPALRVLHRSRGREPRRASRPSRATTATWRRRTACGAVMGKKKLKAVAIVKGTRALRAADPRGVMQAADEIAHDLKTDPRRARSTSTAPSLASRTSPRSGRCPSRTTRPTSRRRGPERVGGAEAPRGLRPPRPPVQRLRHAPLPHVGDPERRPPGPDRRRARVRGLVGRGLDHRAHRSAKPSPGSTPS